ncbi:hypothetical protein [Chlorogloea sp. CCALA 695]|uniref:hypothetical protein n=1 Tax=Chlorogloea sp. CCALA 695 TaxID=2107693 RepID=UPI0011B27055|nr:hypothetical protein [Chlorogloea sp. CCALA 695]
MSDINTWFNGVTLVNCLKHEYTQEEKAGSNLCDRLTNFHYDAAVVAISCINQASDLTIRSVYPKV